MDMEMNVGVGPAMDAQVREMSPRQAKALYNAYNWAQSHGIEPVEDGTMYLIDGLDNICRYAALNDAQWEDVIAVTVSAIRDIMARGRNVNTWDVRRIAGERIRHKGYIYNDMPTLYESRYMAATLAVAMELAREDKRAEYWGSNIYVTVAEHQYGHADTCMQFGGAMIEGISPYRKQCY